MKKIVKIFSIILVLSIIILGGSTYAVKLSSLDVQVSGTTVRPGEEVTLAIQFGDALSSYTINVVYDKNIFEYVSTDGGIATDIGNKLKVDFQDTTGNNSKSNIIIKFKAKEELTSTNPTEFLTTAEGLKSADTFVNYDDVKMPIVKNIVVEPEYVDYTLKLEYIGEVIKNEEKEVKISYSSPSGRYYESAKLIATVAGPEGGNMQLLAVDQAGTEYDIVKTGWGDAQGFPMGGKDYAQVLQTEAIFNENGNYILTLKLVDIENSDSIIAQKSFEFTVGEPEVMMDEPIMTLSEEKSVGAVEDSLQRSQENVQENVTNAVSNILTDTNIVANVQADKKVPKTLPKTGTNIYFILGIVFIALVSGYVYYNKEK